MTYVDGNPDRWRD